MIVLFWVLNFLISWGNAGAGGEWYHCHSPDVWYAVGAFMRLHQCGKLSAMAA